MELWPAFYHLKLQVCTAISFTNSDKKLPYTRSHKPPPFFCPASNMQSATKTLCFLLFCSHSLKKTWLCSCSSFQLEYQITHFLGKGNICWQWVHWELLVYVEPGTVCLSFVSPWSGSDISLDQFQFLRCANNPSREGYHGYTEDIVQITF